MRGFHRFGIPDKQTNRASGIRKGDILIFYISSGVSKLADIREAIEDGTRKLPFGGNYDIAFPTSLSTRPVLTLDPEQWVPLRPMIDELHFTRGKKDWWQAMRMSLRCLDDHDGRLLVAAMKVAVA